MRRSLCYLGRSAIAIGAALLCVATSAGAAAPPFLGAAGSYAVLGGSAVTNTGPTVISGNLGVGPGSSVTGFPPGQLLAGTIHAADAATLAAQNALALAYASAAAEECTANLTGQDLGGLTLVPGVYCFDTSAQLTGTLTLDAQGAMGAVFIFKMGSTLTTASGSSVALIGNASPCSVFWQVGSSATLGTGSTFLGNILASSSITLATGVTLAGRALARSGAVTLDSSAVTAVCAGSLPVCPAITLAPLTAPSGMVGVAYSQLIAASGGAGPYSFTVSGGTPPAGLGLSSSGLLSGTPTAAVTSNFTIRAFDVNACAGSLDYTILVAPAGVVCPAISITPATIPNGRVAVAYTQTLAGGGGTGPYTFAVASGSLPAGVTLSPGGVLAGTPTNASTATFTVTATDANSCAGTSSSYTMVVAPAAPGCPAIAVTPATIPNGRVAVAYSQALAGGGGTGPYTFTVATGTLPAGLTLSSSGVLTGTPTSAGTVTFSVTATDANSCAGTSSPFTIVVAAAAPGCPAITLTPATAPNGTVGVSYSQTFVGSGGTGPYTFALSSGSLPAGLTLSAAGRLAGTPTASTTATFTLRGTDANGCFAEATTTVLIATPVPSLPQVFVLLLALGLAAAGYAQLRYRRAR